MADEVDWAALIAAGRHEELVLQMRRGAERAARVAALRPGWSELGRLLMTLRSALHTELLSPIKDPLAPIELHNANDKSMQAAEIPVRSGARLNPGHRLVEEQLRSYAGAISDHLWGLAAAMAADPPVRPAFVIGRVLLDASAHLYYLTDDSISATERTQRVANIRLGALYDELRDFEDLEEGTERVRREVDDLLSAAKDDGFTVLRRRRGSSQFCLEPRLPPTGQLAAGLLESLGSSAWRTLSSTVHAQDRSVLDLSTGRGDIASTVQGRSQAAVQLFASVLMCTEAAARILRFRDLPLDLTARAAQELHETWSAAAGFSDAAYEAQIG